MPSRLYSKFVEVSMELLRLTGVPLKRETFDVGFWYRGHRDDIGTFLLNPEETISELRVHEHP